MNLTTHPATISPPSQCYWQREFPIPPVRPALKETCSAEFVIVGGGVTGLATANAILEQKPDAEIILLEAEYLGYGASGRAAGLLTPFPAPTWIVGADTHSDQLWGIKYLYDRSHQIADWMRKTIPECQCFEIPIRILSFGPVSEAVITRTKNILEHAGVPFTVNLNEFGQHWPAGYTPSNLIHPFRLICAMANFIESKGVRIFESTSVDSVSQEGDAARILLDNGCEVFANTAIICTNAYSSYISGLGPMNAKSIYSYIAVTEQIDQETANQIDKSITHTFELNKPATYYRVYDRRIFLSAIEKSSNQSINDFEVPKPMLESLTHLFHDSFPNLKETRITDSWSGPYHLTNNDMPIIKRLEHAPSVLLNLGYGSSGLIFAFICAPLAASVALKSKFASADDERLFTTIKNTKPPVMSKLLFAAGVSAALIRNSLFHPKN